jgi:hypothetical protein
MVESPAQRMSLDGAPRVSLSVEGDAPLSHVHAMSSASDLCASPRRRSQPSGEATLSFRGASVPVSAEEAEDLLAYLDANEAGRSRAGYTLRRVAGCVVSMCPPAELSRPRRAAAPGAPRPQHARQTAPRHRGGARHGAAWPAQRRIERTVRADRAR